MSDRDERIKADLACIAATQGSLAGSTTLRDLEWAVAEIERLREELRIARGDFTPAERDQQDFLSGTFEDRQDNA